MNETVSHGFISMIKLIPELDVEYAIEATGGEESLYEKILMRIVRMIPPNIEQMDIFISDDNALADFAVKVHGVKGSLRQAGYQRLARTAETLETAAKAGERFFCASNYGSFRQELMRFCDQVNYAVSQSIGAEAKEETANECYRNISDFFDVLTQVVEAAEAYDTVSASELLLPLTNSRFGGRTDILLAKAMEALDVFKPKQALEYLRELMSGCID